MNEIIVVLEQYSVVMLLMVVNILAGVTLASLKKVFNKEQLKNGLYKACTIVLIISSIVFAGFMNKEFEVNGFTAIEMLLAIAYAADAFYGVQVIEKLTKLVGLSTIPTKDSGNKDTDKINGE